jgi:hypothetical protein
MTVGKVSIYRPWDVRPRLTSYVLTTINKKELLPNSRFRLLIFVVTIFYHIIFTATLVFKRWSFVVNLCTYSHSQLSNNGKS